MATVFTDFKQTKITAPDAPMKQFAPIDHTGVFVALKKAFSEA